MRFQAITSSDALWKQTRDYAFSCSWCAGKSLAGLMDENVFSDWERVIAVLDESESVCGFCTVVKKDCIPELEVYPYIGYVFIEESQRGKRLGQQMLEYAMLYLRNCGFDCVYLVSDHLNLYEKYGFRAVEKTMAPWGAEETLYTHEINA